MIPLQLESLMVLSRLIFILGTEFRSSRRGAVESSLWCSAISFPHRNEKKQQIQLQPSNFSLICIFIENKYKNGGWRDCSVVGSTCCSCRGLEFGSHIRQLTPACNSSSRGSNVHFWLPQAPVCMCTSTYTETHAHTQSKIK